MDAKPTQADGPATPGYILASLLANTPESVRALRRRAALLRGIGLGQIQQMERRK